MFVLSALFLLFFMCFEFFEFCSYFSNFFIFLLLFVFFFYSIFLFRLFHICLVFRFFPTFLVSSTFADKKKNGALRARKRHSLVFLFFPSTFIRHLLEFSYSKESSLRITRVKSFLEDFSILWEFCCEGIPIHISRHSSFGDLRESGDGREGGRDGRGGASVILT